MSESPPPAGAGAEASSGGQWGWSAFEAAFKAMNPTEEQKQEVSMVFFRLCANT